MGLFLKQKKSGTKFSKHTILEEDLFIRRKEKMEPWGEFPRRVLSGEPIFEIDHCLVLSPVNGIARNTESGISITQDGLLQQRQLSEKKEFSYDEILDKVRAMSIISLDFPCQPLVGLFQKAKTEEFDIIFSPFSRTNNIDFAAMIMNELKDEFMQFKGNLMTVFRGSPFKDFIGPANLKYQYPDGIPEFFIQKFTDTSVIPDKTLYLGAETIYHMLRALYLNIPFYQRYITVNFADKWGNVDIGNEAYLVFNGQSLNFIKNKIPAKYNYFTYNSFYESNEVFSRDDQFYIDIFRDYSITFFEKKYERSPVCLDCNYCNYLCPVGANPYLLVSRESGFKKELCFDCGICSVHCPGGVNLRQKIKDVKNG